MSDRKTFKQTIEKWGATFEEDDNGVCKSLFIDAPEDKEWMASLANCICVPCYYKSGDTFKEMYTRAVEEMNQGFTN